MGEHEIAGKTGQELSSELTESNDSVETGQTVEELTAVLNSLLEAVEDGVPLHIQGHKYIPATAIKELSNNNRRLNYQLKEANRNVGKQGQTIHLLRAELAEVRQLNSRAERGEIRYLDRQVTRLNVLLDSAREEISALNSKLSEQDTTTIDLDEIDGVTGLDEVYTGPLDGGDDA